MLLGGRVSLGEAVLPDDEADVEPPVFCSEEDAVVADELKDVVDDSGEDDVKVVGEDESVG